MRDQPKAIYEIIKSKYPLGKLKVCYTKTHNYIDYSDRINVTCNRNIDIDEAIVK